MLHSIIQKADNNNMVLFAKLTKKINSRRKNCVKKNGQPNKKNKNHHFTSGETAVISPFCKHFIVSTFSNPWGGFISTLYEYRYAAGNNRK